MKKTCPKCGKEFECTHDEKCWCNSIKISKSVNDIISANFNDCICEDCLISLGAKKKALED